MARVRSIPSSELPADLAAIYERFAGTYGPFRNQAAVFAHVPAALRHLMPMLMELREAATLPKRVIELAIVTVSEAQRVRLLRGASRRSSSSRVSRAAGPSACSTTAATPNSTTGTSLSSSTRSPPGSARTAFRKSYLPGFVTISARRSSSS